MPPLLRSGSMSQAMALAEQLPLEVLSAEDVEEVVETALQIAANLEVAPSGMKDLLASDDRLTPARVHNVVKAYLPSVVKATNASTAIGPVVGKTISSLVKSVQYLSGPQYRKSIVDDVLSELRSSGALGTTLNPGQKRISQSPAPSGARKKQAKRNKHLEDIIHYFFHKLHDKSFNRPGWPVVSQKTIWEDGCPGGKRTVTLDNGEQQVVRCPDWEKEKDLESQNFRSDVVAAAVLEPDWGSEPPSIAHSLALTYWRSIVSERKKARDSSVREAAAISKELKQAKGRTTKLVHSMTAFLPRSKIHQCAEGRLIQAAVLSGALAPTLWAKGERHPFRKVTTKIIDQSEEGELAGPGDLLEEEVGYDAWTIWADFSAEGRTEDNVKLWAVDQPQWWSRSVKLGFWYLYEESQPSTNRAFTRMPLFHLPVDQCTPLSLSTLPPITPSDTKELSVLTSAVGDNSRANHSWEISVGMVDSTLTSDPAYGEWSAQLYRDPVSIPAQQGLPCIEDWIDSLPDRDLRKRVLSHVEPPPSIDDSVLERLWRIREHEGAYKAAVRADDIGVHFAVQDAVDGMDLA